MGLLEALEPESYDRHYTDRELVHRIGSHFAGKLRLLACTVITLTLTAVTGAAFPVLLSHAVDALARHARAGTVALVAAGILTAGIATWSFNLGRQWCAARMIGDMVLELRKDVFGATMRQDMGFFDEHPAGEIAGRVALDTQALATMIQISLDVIGEALLILLVTAVLFRIDAQLALLTLMLAVVVVVVTVAFRLLARQAAQRLQRAIGYLNAHLQESLGGIIVARNFRQEQRLYQDLVDADAEWYVAATRVGTLFSGIFPFLLTLAGLGTVVVVSMGGRRVLTGSLTPGEWFLFVQSVALFWDPLTNIASFWSQFQHGLSAGERVFALIDAQPGVTQRDQRPVRRLTGQIDFENVTFRYTDRETVLDAFDLRIEAGETIALVGHTGAGKSSVARLILRSYEFQAGHLAVDGQDIRTLDLDSYRRHVGVVPQMPFLFSGSVEENIRYARPRASDGEVAAAANRFAGGDWLEHFARGLQTPVGERGKNLSTGQRQLVALARVVLQDPSILILDEATASIDPMTEAEIQEGLDVVLRGRTSIVIAHRLPTVRKADRIVVLSQGRIVEQGNHEGLLRAGGYYCTLYEQYFRHQMLDSEIDVTGNPATSTVRQP